LIYNSSFRPELVVYDREYQNEQGLSTSFQTHLENVIQIINRSLGKENLVEVGCGKGMFFELLESKGYQITGFDPTYEGKNPKIHRHFFEKGININSDGIILRHVLEHIPEPVSFIKQLSENNNRKGRIYIEVPCFDWICKHRAWFDIFYEHVNYFRLTDFERIFGNIIESGRLFGGQYLYVVADLSDISTPSMNETDKVNFPNDFTDKIESIQLESKSNIIIWGGASKGVIFSLMMMKFNRNISTVIDINPEKQGKYLPLTGLEVQSPDAALSSISRGENIYVMNSNYLEEIKYMTNNLYNYLTIDHE
jgi:SAM-dependent methyltransferase